MSVTLNHEPFNYKNILKTTKQYGEKGHVEYGWSYNQRERILQFSFQLVRCDHKRIQYLQDIYYHLLCEFTLKYKMALTTLEKDMSMDFLKILYKMVGQTRDIVEGKGEYALSYMMIYTWYLISPELACYALKSFVVNDNNSTSSQLIPYGSWKDIKYFCNYCISKGLTKDHYLIIYAVTLMNDQLKKDSQSLLEGDTEKISLAAKWVPRERSNKFGWLYELLSTQYFLEYIKTAKTNESLRRAILKCNMDYRKLVSRLNDAIDTLQIKQCNHRWSHIDLNKVTSISLSKQSKAFLNITKNGVQRSNTTDRVECASHFLKYIEQLTKNPEKSHVKGKRLGLNDFTKQALDLIDNPNTRKEEIDLLNAQWLSHSQQNDSLGKMIAMVDLSGSMEREPMNAAIALAIRVAEKSALGKRVLTFSGNPRWINLDKKDDSNHGEGFVSMVKSIKEESEWGTNTNFYAALSMILDTIVEVKMPPEEVQDLMLVVFSDMQIEDCYNQNEDHNIINEGYLTLHEKINEKYKETGIRLHGKPYKPPHILFWNLRLSGGFPSLSNQANCSMLSGYNPVFMNLFCEQGSTSLQSCTPWDLLMKSLDKKQYLNLEKKCLEFFSRY